ncbi:alpha/beta hydrolase family esterase [Pseudosulfitobacter pseudonitzschiae]|uniref:alpha/beta hydrolase family esterase n=2 Tax=Pseudosulfitobacter pseudonitzschiae TaxID=1402135 RepID=UPI001AF5CF09|nr:polyhydroxybutyrate depolymerase [Pseudosulfitobacter pseudonitzschiae]MBM1815023.1 polyhydroxybutyrate depolymerase [Pseudosulfitobacter pseudonitzschiae]MBM1832014.1 polyhydroxybutyrate depolymerase [Pseudosulfitobacter pseudonitzschiae]MBM1836882.1 polyhydroxybutyrate depolymerase [Pseudosulfitobacter pseudonitzschiae]MBM1841728.1 polyhydroxybutyrate depolymerase [Pseudosulfitobacter pseudonitzschiae]MBM1846596.1 polyhydroxybutyrate depolymerase [Pseudosulfitobacter pseudonitzschiae]
MKAMHRLCATLVLLATAQTAAADCGDAPGPCEIDSGTYHVILPDGPPKGAIMFLHGYGGNGLGSLGRNGWAGTALARGYAVIGPDGDPMEGREGRSWSFHPNGPEVRDETAFLTAVRDDAAARFGLDADSMVLAGFSIGGSMTHYLACAAPQAFAAYLPVGGAFWRPHPETCAGPVKLLHTHGWTDTTVPLEGRVIGGRDVNDPQAFVQGDVFYAMRLWRQVNGCVQLAPDRFVAEGPFMRRAWDRCTPGSALEFALFPGGHRVPDGWIDMALDWREGL